MFINRAKSAHAAGQVKPLSLSQLERYQALFLPLALSAFAWSSPKLECIVLLQLRLCHKFTFFASKLNLLWKLTAIYKNRMFTKYQLSKLVAWDLRITKKDHFMHHIFAPKTAYIVVWSDNKLLHITHVEQCVIAWHDKIAQAILSCGAKLIATWSNFDPHDKRNCHVEKNFPHDFFDPQIMSAASATNMMNEPHGHTLSGIPTNKSFRYRKSTKTIMSAHWLKDEDDY